MNQAKIAQMAAMKLKREKLMAMIRKSMRMMMMMMMMMMNFLVFGKAALKRGNKVYIHEEKKETRNFKPVRNSMQ